MRPTGTYYACVSTVNPSLARGDANTGGKISQSYNSDETSTTSLVSWLKVFCLLFLNLQFNRAKMHSMLGENGQNSITQAH